MAIKLGDAFVELSTKDSLDKGLKAANLKVGGWLRDISTGIAQGVGQALAQGLGNLARAAVSEIGKATASADTLNQAIIRTQKVFGDSTDEIQAWAQTADRALGLSEASALSNISALGNMLVQLGATRDQAALMSKQMVETAADVAAFSGASGGAAEVLDTVNSAFRGEYDALQRYIPALSDAAIKQQALAESGKETADQLTSLDRALATHTLIMEGATGASGSFADALERGLGAQQVFEARMENARADIGQVGLIIQREFFESLNEILDSMGFYGENIVEQLVVGLTKGLVAITPFMAQLRAVFAYWLKPGSPPRLLKDITDWGKGAVDAYMEGWTDADFSALQELGAGIENALRSFAGAGQLGETDLVARIFGSQKELASAISQWRTLGTVSTAALEAIRRSAGPAGDGVISLVSAYFDLQAAAQGASEAQRQLSEVTRQYDAALSPLQKRLDDLQDAQQQIHDEQRLQDLGKIIADPRADTAEKRLARFEQEEILLRQQMESIEEERDTAVDAEQAKIDAANAEQAAKQAVYDQQKAMLDQQVESNRLIEEETALRTRLADEALAKEEEARRKLEEQQRKEAAELERIADAHLRYQLATTDTAGQLELMRGELAKTTEGSAEYWSILTDIANLEERIAKEQESGGGAANAIVEAGKASLEQKQYLIDFAAALNGVTDAMSGEGEAAELTPFWAGVAETVTKISDAVTKAQPLIQGFFDLIMGKNVEGVEGVTDPFGDNWWLKGIVPGVNSIITALKLIQEGDWAGVWKLFKDEVDGVLEYSDEGADPDTFTFYKWIKDTLIPALELLAVEGWAGAWKLFKTSIDGILLGIDPAADPSTYALYKWIDETLIPAVELLAAGGWQAAWDLFKGGVDGLLASIDPAADPDTFALYKWIDETLIPALELLAAGEWKTVWEDFAKWASAPFENMFTEITEKYTALEAWIQDFMGKHGFPTNPYAPEAVPGSGSGGGGGGGGFGEPDYQTPYNALPLQPFASYTPPSAPAQLSGGDSHDTYYIEQHIAANSDFGGAREGADAGMRAILNQRRLQGA